MCDMITCSGATFQVHRFEQLHIIDDVHDAFISTMVQRVPRDLRIGRLETTFCPEQILGDVSLLPFSRTNHTECANTFPCNHLAKFSNLSLNADIWGNESLAHLIVVARLVPTTQL